jgi:hypothetical protein
MEVKSNELSHLLENFKDFVVETSKIYGGYAAADTNDEETGCGSDNHCDDCKNDPVPNIPVQ